MAQVTGIVCDVCERFSVQKDGWMRLSVLAGESGGIDVCSNNCLLKLARQRRDESDDKRDHVKRQSTSGKFSDEQKYEIVQVALDTSVHQAAEKYGVPWQAVARWKSDIERATE